MQAATEQLQAITLRQSAHPITGATADYDPRLSDQFDAILHLDETRALEPLERTAEWETGEPAETFPTGI